MENKHSDDREVQNLTSVVMGKDFLAREALTRQIDVSTDFLTYKTWLGIIVSVIAIIIHLAILYAAYMLLFCGYTSDKWVKIASISASVLSFVVIYGIIIRTMLGSPQQDKDNSNLPPIRDFLKAVQQNSDNQ